MAWREEDTAEALRAAYRVEKDREVRQRRQGLWLLRTGRTLEEVTAVVGVHYRTVQRWAAWYGAGGMAVADHAVERVAALPDRRVEGAWVRQRPDREGDLLRVGLRLGRSGQLQFGVLHLRPRSGRRADRHPIRDREPAAARVEIGQQRGILHGESHLAASRHLGHVDPSFQRVRQCGPRRRA